MRIDKNNYYLDIAGSVCGRGTCLKRNYGAVIVNNDEIVSTGYTGAPRGVSNCCDTGECIRIKYNVPRGRDYTLCRSAHAEWNAIISASRKEMIGSTLYLCAIEKSTGKYSPNRNCCSICKRMIINAGIIKVIIRDTKKKYREINVEDWINDEEALCGINGY